MDRGAWQVTVDKFAKESDTTERLNNCNVIGKEVISVDNKVTVPVDIYINNQVLILSWSQKT